MTNRHTLNDPTVWSALEKLPALCATDGLKEDRPAVRFFTPRHNAQWVIWEYDTETREGFGLADLGHGFPEIGKIGLQEWLDSPSIYIERDAHSDTLVSGYAACGEDVPDFIVTPGWTAQDAADFLCSKGYKPEDFADQFAKWLDRGDGIAIYELADFSDPDNPLAIALSFGSEDAQIVGFTPPEKCPDLDGAVRGWQYRLHAFVAPPLTADK